MMILIVVIALMSALVIQSIRATRLDRERARLALPLAEYRRETDWVKWAERMHAKGYVSKALVESERVNLKKTLFELRLQH
jgi:hypothetical protein